MPPQQKQPPAPADKLEAEKHVHKKTPRKHSREHPDDGHRSRVAESPSPINRRRSRHHSPSKGSGEQLNGESAQQQHARAGSLPPIMSPKVVSDEEEVAEMEVPKIEFRAPPVPPPKPRVLMRRPQQPPAQLILTDEPQLQPKEKKEEKKEGEEVKSTTRTIIFHDSPSSPPPNGVAPTYLLPRVPAQPHPKQVTVQQG